MKRPRHTLVESRTGLWVAWSLTRVVVLALSWSVASASLFHDPTLVWSWANDAPFPPNNPGVLIPTLSEYPLLFRVIASAAVLAPGIASFTTVWIVVTLVVDAVVLSLLRSRGSMASAGWWVVVGACLGPVLWLRMDLLVVLLVMFSLMMRNRRSGISGLVLALAVLLKLWPLVLVPLMWVGWQRWRWSMWFGAALGLGTMTDLVLNGREAVLGPWVYQTGRGIQVESLWGSLVLLLKGGGDTDDLLEYRFRSWHLVEGCWDAAAVVALAAIVLAGLAAAWSLRRRPTATVAERSMAASAAIVTVVAFGTVLSPQYIVWFAPVVLLASAGMRQQRTLGTLVAIIAVMTHVLWPYAYPDLLAGDMWAVALLVVRNVTLVTLAALLWRAAFLAALIGHGSDQPGRTAPATGIE